MKIARVRVDLAIGREFDYLIPDELESRVEVGVRVKAPFGKRELLGWVVEISDQSEHPELKPIIDVIGGYSLLTESTLKLAKWIARYYACPLETALKSVFPTTVRKEKSGWKEALFIERIETDEPDNVEKLPPKQKTLWDYLKPGEPETLQSCLAALSITAAVARGLEKKQLARIWSDKSLRNPTQILEETLVATKDLELSSDQRHAFGTIRTSIQRGESRNYLLYGVTGSGKTEVYLQALAECLRQGRGAIVLVPEIALTPQTVERFKARFMSGELKTEVAVLHSHLSSGERHDEWHKIRQGKARIVIGARSAIFSPVHPLGLIIVDEEHEGSYKQEEAPRYHARDVAAYRARMEGAVAVFGSATPSMESYTNALNGKYELLRLDQRIDDRRMPVVRVVDMRMESRREKRKGGRTIFSVPLKEAIISRLEKGEQTILFLNRRGYATSMLCPECGYVAECPNCSLALTFHFKENRLRCHLCGHDQAAHKKCPEKECGSPGIRYSGIGTEKVEEVLGKLFPKARMRRMDSDTLKRKTDYEVILGAFRRGQIDILLGTQMIAKGLHFPNVTLVGIIHADLTLHAPDFRAAERTFQLLTQVAGRAGRGDVEGEVVVQSFTPFHDAIQHAKRHDFEGFYDAEIEFRKQLQYPPFHRIALITVRGEDEQAVEQAAEEVRIKLDKRLQGIGWKGKKVSWELRGPSPAPLARAESKYRYQLMLKTDRMSAVGPVLQELRQYLKFSKKIQCVFDVDPMNLI